MSWSDSLVKPIPCLPVKSVPDAVEFYTKVLGFTLGGDHGRMASVSRGPKAGVNIYLFRWSTTREGLAHPDPENAFADGKRPFTPSWMLIHLDGVGGVDEFAAELQAKGVSLLEPVEDKEWGYRQMAIEDVDGHRLTFFEFLPHIK